ncbi:MAG TPA: peptidase M48 Ste24p [Thioalkalivibrio sp.]|nr:peptidase M48 Ste24p [Thioalkalivibrio sp.]
MSRTLLASLFLLAFAALSGCATNPVTGGQDFVLMTQDQEIATGRQYHQQLLQQHPTYEDPRLQAYVSRIGDELARNSHRSELVFHFTVLDSQDVNAFALPGGYVYITRGIMAYMNSEAELAGVLGHEIGHVTARHGVRQQSAATVTGILGAVISARAGSQAAGDLSNMLGTALIRGYGREHELEADRLGAEYLARVGYDPQEMLGVVGILKDQEEFEKQRAAEEGREPRIYHGVFATHPANDARLQEVVRAADRFKGSATRSAGRDTYLGMIDGMVWGPGEKQGVLRGRDFYHRDLGITLRFPQDWRVENQPDRLLTLPRDGSAMLQLTVEPLNERLTARQLLESKFKTNSLREGRALNIPGMDGYTALATLNTPFGQRATRTAVIVHDKNVYLFLAASKADGVRPQQDTLFLATIEGFRSLRADEATLAESRRIHVITAKAGDTFARLARDTDLNQHAEEILRLLNGMYPDGEPTPGQRIKIIK